MNIILIVKEEINLCRIQTHIYSTSIQNRVTSKPYLSCIMHLYKLMMLPTSYVVRLLSVIKFMFYFLPVFRGVKVLSLKCLVLLSRWVQILVQWADAVVKVPLWWNSSFSHSMNHDTILLIWLRDYLSFAIMDLWINFSTSIFSITIHLNQIHLCNFFPFFCDICISTISFGVWSMCRLSINKECHVQTRAIFILHHICGSRIEFILYYFSLAVCRQPWSAAAMLANNSRNCKIGFDEIPVQKQCNDFLVANIVEFWSTSSL